MRSRSPSAADSEARNCATSSSRLVLPVRSSDSRSESREILRVEPRQRGVLAGDFLRQEELRHHEHGEQKMIDRISVDSASTKPGQ
jgi:hypothetical protein